MALTFAGGNTDRVDIGNAAVLQGLTTGSIVAWVNPSALAGSRYVFGGRYGVGGVSCITLLMNDTSGNMRLGVIGSTNLTYTASSLGLTVGAWAFVAGTFVFGTSGHVYIGNLTTAAAEPTYSANNNGATQQSESAGSFLWGDRYTAVAVASQSFAGQIAWGQVYNRALSLGEIQSLQFSPRRLSGCIDYHQFGFNGTSTQPDWSGNGNAGTVTGATQSAHVPLGPMFGYSPMQVPYVVAAAGGFLPAWARGSNQLIGSGAYVS